MAEITLLKSRLKFERPVRLYGVISGIILGLIVGLFIGIPNAYAATEISSWRTFLSNTVHYNNLSVVSNNPGNADFTTHVSRKSHGKARAGKMGGAARGYFDDGFLCTYTPIRYNLSATTSFNIHLHDGDCAGFMYSQGYTATWNGNGYRLLGTYRTANLLFL